jgi:hypothetical protein
MEEGRMRRTMAVAALAVGVLWADVGHAQRGEPPTSPFGYAVFSLGNILLRDGVRAIDGDVGSNNGTATVGKNVLVAGSVVGRTIKLRSGAKPDSLFCLLLQGKVSNQACQAVTLPVVNTTDLPGVQVIPGTTPVKVPQGSSTSPIPAGAYGKVMVRSNATLMLAGGTFVFKSIQVGSRGQLLCADACQIGVADTVRLKPNAVMAGTSGTRAEQVRVNVAKTSKNTVFSAGKQATVFAVVYAPGGRVELGNHGNFVGAFVGSVVNIDKGAIVQAPRP